MNKKLLTVLAVLAVATVVLWFQRGNLVLGAVEVMTDQRYDEIAPNREISWDVSSGPAKIDAEDPPPNIILIVADDLGYNDISTFGGGVTEGFKTPGIDRLAEEGVVFSQAYSGASTCAPSRAMLMTGRYPTRTGFEFTPTPAGMARAVSTVASTVQTSSSPPYYYDAEVERSHPSYEEKGLLTGELTIAELLRDSDYYTAHIGKWHLGRENGMGPNAQGFDDSLLMTSGLYLPEDHPDVVNAKLDFDPIDRFLWAAMRYAASFNTTSDDVFEPDGYLTDYWTDESVKVIRNNKDRPFFLYLAHWGPHTPLQATRADYEAVGDIRPHRKRVYAAMIRAVDRSVSRILDTLEEEGIADNTMVVFTSDNGGAGYIGLPGVNQPFRGWKITMFEGGIRVPLFMKWPAQLPAGTVVETPTAHIDVMPTIAAATGAVIPEGVAIDGVPLLDLAQGQSDAEWTRDTLFWQNGHYQVVRHNDWKLQVNERRTDGKKVWLFDLATDPTEQVNLAPTRPKVVAQLERLLNDHNADSVGSRYAPAMDSAILVDKTVDQPFVDGDEYVYTPN
ncbi:MAG: sulfatase-like hydrolase/transferase [Luminiphilus sp.]|nr:sulfatase-like hydrolase/transferase [Luminiphilus sp.]